MSNIAAKPTVGIVTFDGYVSLYAETLRYLSWKLQKLDCNIVKVGCDGVLNACTSLNSIGKNEVNNFNKDLICKYCKQAQANISAEVINNITWDDGERLGQEAVRFLDEVEKKLNESLIISSVLDMHFQDLPLCKIAFFDFSITLKLSPDSQLNNFSISRFMFGLKDLILLKKHLDTLLKNNNLSYILYINGNYSLNTLVRLLCENKKITCLSIEPQLTSQHILNYIFIKRSRLELSPEALFAINPEINAQRKDLKNVIKTFNARITGGDFNAYTSLDNVNYDQQESVKIKTFFDTYNRIHSFFMSSEDELIPHAIAHDFFTVLDEKNSAAYKNQFEFTQFYLAEAAKNPQIGFILRLHPRMAVNKRDAFESAEHIRYKNLLEQTSFPSNILILFGDNKISSYYIISKSSLVIISWSTIGLEALMMGASVVSAFPNNLMYPLGKISKQPQSFEELKSALFTISNFGVIDDIGLLNWISMAYEGQFFPTLAPRGNNLQGKFYSLIYRLINKIGVYNLFAYIVDKLLFKDIVFSNEVLLNKQTKDRVLFDSKSSLDLINTYRIEVKKIFNQYEKKLFKY